MPFIDGASLRQRLAEPRHMEADQALAIAAPVADALFYAHRMGVLHRDIKPENILFSQGHPIVADFGAEFLQTAPALKGPPLRQRHTTCCIEKRDKLSQPFA